MNPKIFDAQHHDSLGLYALTCTATATAAAASYLITSNLPYMISAITCSLVISFLTSASTRAFHPILWWGNLGAIAGCIVGTSIALSEALSNLGLSSRELWRWTVVASLSLSGLVSGILLSRNLGKDFKVRPPKDFIRAASGLTASAFAVLVSIRFALDGLEAARALSSRLSTMTTVLVTTLALPGYARFQLGRLIGDGRLPPNKPV